MTSMIFLWSSSGNTGDVCMGRNTYDYMIQKFGVKE